MPKCTKLDAESMSDLAEKKHPSSYAKAHKTALEGVKKHGKAETTTGNYLGHIRRGREFLENFVLEESEAEGRWHQSASSLSIEGEEGTQISGENNAEAKMPPQFREAFTGPPIDCTPLAISMFVAFKCYTHNCGKSTASAIHAAFLRHYDQMDGDKYRGRWKYNHNTKEWAGNPVRCAEVEDQVAACKNKDGEGERKHSRAMSIEDMQRLLLYSRSTCPPGFDLMHNLGDQRKYIAERGTFLLFNALSTSAFTVWMRIGEVISLKYKNFEFPVGREHQNTDSRHYFRLNLRNRKNWQKREKNGEHQLNGHTYMIYGQPHTPEIDMHSHLLDWLDFYETVLLRRPLAPEDYIFPTIGTNGMSVQPDRPITHDIAQKKINQMAKEAGIHGAQYFTTHCFRRGGAQYRFMFAPLGERWTLARIRWWGGWATGEHRDTLIRYLLDELYTYEEDHSNALCPDNLEMSQKVIINSAPPLEVIAGFTRQVTQQISTIQVDLKDLKEHGISSKHGNLQCRLHHHVNATSSQASETAVFTPLPQSSSVTIFNSTTTANTTSSIIMQDIEPQHLIPGIPRKLASRAFVQVAKDWEFADPSRSLYVPMKSWKPEWHKATGQSQKYGQRQTVALEFIEHYNYDEAAFKKAYPEHSKGFTPLLNAIRRAQKIRGECEERQKRRKINP